MKVLCLCMQRIDPVFISGACVFSDRVNSVNLATESLEMGVVA